MLRPDYVIPFKLDKQAAKDALKKFYKGKVLLPKMFREENNIDKITGIYVPFWLFDCEANGRMSFDATRISSWRSGQYQYTKTSHFLVRRSGEMAFENIPVDASEKMDDAYMDSLEPFNYNEMVDFGSAYLSGFFADRYDVSDEECSPRAAKRVRTSLEDELRATVVGYSGVTTKSSNIKTSNGDIKYALFPVYMLNTKYRDKTYTFAMNGQTGKLWANCLYQRQICGMGGRYCRGCGSRGSAYPDFVRWRMKRKILSLIIFAACLILFACLALRAGFGTLRS